MSNHLTPGNVVRTHETRVVHPVYFDGPVSVIGLGHARGKAPRTVFDRVLTNRVKMTRLAARQGWYSFREVGPKNRARTLYFHGSATVFVSGMEGTVEELFTAAVRLADRTA